MNGSDHELLRRYASDGSQAAFAELVRRYVDLVYSAARRQVRSSTLAEEVAQSVFFDLSRHATKLKPATPLVAWLHVVTRRTAIDTIRRESRRQQREQAAMELTAMKPNPSPWTEVEPLLDEALEKLGEPDRVAILLRYFENKSLHEIAVALGTTDDAAQKRVSRALDRLRSFLLRRGVAVGAVTLATDLSAHGIQAAPALLGTNITAAAASTALQVAANPATGLTMTLLEKSILTVSVIFTLGGSLVETNALLAERTKFALLRQRADALATETGQAQTQLAAALRRGTEARQRLAARTAIPETASDLALRATMTGWLERMTRIRQTAAAHPELAIPEFAVLTDDDWYSFATGTPREFDDPTLAMAGLRFIADGQFARKLRSALLAYLAANNGVLPTDCRQLVPFFAQPIPPAVLDGYQMTAQGKISELNGMQRDSLIEKKSALDWEKDSLWRINQTTEISIPAIVRAATNAINGFKTANNGTPPTDPAQLIPYLPAPIDPARLAPYLPSGGATNLPTRR